MFPFDIANTLGRASARVLFVGQPNAQPAPLSHRKNPRRGWDKPGPTRIRMHQKLMPAGRTSTLRKAMRAAGAK